jgi:hypothetical protein
MECLSAFTGIRRGTAAMADLLLILLLAGAVLLILRVFAGGAAGPARNAGGAQSKRYFYRSPHIRKPFTFDMVRQADGEVRIYILDGPSYGRRATDGHSTHRYTDYRGRPYICVERGLHPTNFHDAESWARYWADGTAKYIRTGRPFA